MALFIRGKTWWIDLTVGKKRVRKSAKTEDLKTAERVHKKLETEMWLNEHKPVTKDADKFTLGEAFDRGYREHWSHQRSASTVFHNFKSIEAFFGRDWPIVKMDRNAIREYIAHMRSQGWLDSGINRKLALISKLLKLCVDWGKLPLAPMVPKLKESPGRIRVVSKEEVDEVVRLFKEAGKDNMADLTIVLVDTGMRLSEALNLKAEDVNWESGMIHIWLNKADHPRSVPMTQRVKQLLKARQDRMFSELSYHGAEHHWRWVRRKMGLEHDTDFVMHALRHTTASRLVQRGEDLMRVKDFMGHKSIHSTLRYAHLRPEHLQSCVTRLEE
jgi:integrase